MGFQSGINAALGSIAGAAFGIQKTLQQRQEEQLEKVKQVQEAKKKQQRTYKSFKKALYAQEDVAPLGEKAKKAIYEQTKGNKAFKQEVINKYYGNK